MPAPTRDEQKENTIQSSKLKKPPPITPRRFTRFFTPRPRNAAAASIRTSRAALRVLSGSSLNSRSAQPVVDSKTRNDITAFDTPRGKKRKLSFVTNDSTSSTPISQAAFLHGSQEIRSSPTIPERCSPLHRSRRDVSLFDDEEAETDIEVEDEEEQRDPVPRMIPYRARTTSGSILSTRLSGRRVRHEASPSKLWQQQTGHFYSSPSDVNNSFSQNPVALPFSVATCNTNPLIATGDEEGTIRIIDSSPDSNNGFTKTFIEMTPHDNALMDLEFSEDDAYLATACGDQTCSIIDMHTQTVLFSLGGHRCSVKRVSFQPGSGGNILASCGRDGQLNFWDLRCNQARNQAHTRRSTSNSMTENVKALMPTHFIRDAHTAGPRSAKTTATKTRPNLVPGRADFSVTSLSFLGASRSHLIVTASEIDTTIKVWDIRTHHTNSRRTPTPLACTDEPKSHAFHRRFGVTSLAVSTDASRMYALSRDHTVYAYSTAHLILGSSPRFSSSSKPPRQIDSGNEGLGPIYGFRHPSLRVSTFWPRLSIRKATDSNCELLAVGSSDDCAVLFPTDERYLTKTTMNIPSLHVSATKFGSFSSRPPTLTRSMSATSATGIGREIGDEGISIYSHGTPLTRGHDKEVTSLAWTSEGSLITASDDYTVRCWREDPANARRMRDQGEKNGERWKKGWADVGIEEFDEEC